MNLTEISERRTGLSTYNVYDGQLVVVDAKGKPVDGCKLVLKGRIDGDYSSTLAWNPDTESWEKPTKKNSDLERKKVVFRLNGDIEQEVSARMLFQRTVAAVAHGVDPAASVPNWKETPLPTGPVSKSEPMTAEQLEAVRVKAEQLGVELFDGITIAQFKAAVAKAMGL